MYIVTRNFVDLADGNHRYKLGDEYPRKGANPSEERIENLLKGNNQAGLKLIKEVKGAEEPKEEPKAKKPAKKKTSTRKKTGGKKASE